MVIKNSANWSLTSLAERRDLLGTFFKGINEVISPTSLRHEPGWIAPSSFSVSKEPFGVYIDLEILERLKKLRKKA